MTLCRHTLLPSKKRLRMIHRQLWRGSALKRRDTQHSSMFVAAWGSLAPPARLSQGRLLTNVGSDWDANDSKDRKTSYAASTMGASDVPQSRSPVHYAASEYAEHDPRSGHCLPEAVVTSSLPEVVDMSHRRQTMASTIRTTQPYSPNNETMSMAPPTFLTVTPLHLLGDQPDMIDCPFCLRRTETKVVREASPVTQ